MSSCSRLAILGWGTLLAGIGGTLPVATSLCASSGPPGRQFPDSITALVLSGEQRDWPAGLCAPEVALPLQRRLDPAALRVASDVGPDEELEAIRSELLALADAARDGADLRYACIAGRLGPRWALFPWRFGCAPRELAGWPDLVAAAGTLLDDAECGRIPGWGECCTYGGGRSRCFLLDLVGRAEEAARRLAELPIDTFCGNCWDALVREVSLQQAALAEERGDLAGALTLLEEGLAGNRLNGPSQDFGSATRCGVLLLLAGRDAEGVGMLQQVVDLHPRTAEADVAAAALAQVGAPRETTPQRLRTVYILPLGRRDPRRRAALDRLVAGREGATAREFDDLVDACLAGDLAAWKQLATVHDMRASELLHEGLRSSEKIAIIVEAARGLFAREGSEVPLAEAVARIDDELFLQGPYTGAELDAALRPLTGEGPALATDPAPDLHVAARAWRTWLASCGYR